MLELAITLLAIATTRCPSEDSGTWCHYETDSSIMIALDYETGALDIDPNSPQYGQRTTIVIPREG